MSASSYTEGKSIREVTQDNYRRLLSRADAGELNDETAAGVGRLIALQFTLSGGGPGSDVVFLLDGELEEGGEVREGFYSYYEAGGTEVVAFGATDGQMILDGLLSAVDETEDER